MTDKKIKKIEMRHTAAEDALVKEGLTAALSTVAGRMLFWRLLSLSGMYMNPHSGNALNTAFAAGRQSVGQDIIGLIEDVDPNSYINMMKENVERDQALKTTLAKEMENVSDDDEA